MDDGKLRNTIFPFNNQIIKKEHSRILPKYLWKITNEKQRSKRRLSETKRKLEHKQISLPPKQKINSFPKLKRHSPLLALPSKKIPMAQMPNRRVIFSFSLSLSLSLS
jgi:hypothetical protein